MAIPATAWGLLSIFVPASARYTDFSGNTCLPLESTHIFMTGQIFDPMDRLQKSLQASLSGWTLQSSSRTSCSF
jgi:hypothetical protein